jgi:DNA-directed RNA polymerase subunit RPC12/RpoP
VVARHTRRASWRATCGCVCIDCGTRYLLTNAYKGNYCADCHERWVDRQRDDSVTGRALRRVDSLSSGRGGDEASGREDEDVPAFDDLYDAA